MILLVTMTDTRGQKISVDPAIVQFVRLADNSDNECLIVFGKDQLLRVRDAGRSHAGSAGGVSDCVAYCATPLPIGAKTE